MEHPLGQEGYGGWLDEEEYAPASLYLEINTIKQTINWLIREGHLPESAKINLAVKKVGDSDAFCYRPEHVNAILSHAFGIPDLHWLGNVIVGLVYTGLRISELAQLRWAATLTRRSGATCVIAGVQHVRLLA